MGISPFALIALGFVLGILWCAVGLWPT